MSGKQVKLFLVDGTPGGLTTAEITNWTGHVLAGPRSDLARLLGRDEARRTGVYLLLGEGDGVGEGRLYVGEADDVATRLRTHERTKDFWDRVVVITSKDTNLTKAHVRYLEASLIRLAATAQRMELTNGTAPPQPNLPEADASDMDYFVGQLQIVLPVLGINAFRGRKTKPAAPVAPEPVESPVFHLRVAKSHIYARATQIDGEFTLLEGSTTVPSWERTGGTEKVRSIYARLRAQFEKLVETDAIIVEGRHGRVARDIVFPSSSAAGAIVTGRSCNGRTSWVTDDGLTFGDWETRGVDDSSPHDLSGGAHV